MHPPNSTHPHSCMQDGTKSVILEWEKKYVSDQGALSNPELSRVVEAISYFQ